MADRLPRQLTDCRKLWFALGGGQTENWVFPRRRDPRLPWSPSATSRRWDRLRDDIPDLAGVRLYDLRHHVATRLLDAGLPVGHVADVLGHDPTMTMKVYRHWIPGQEHRAAQIMEALHGGLAGPQLSGG